MNTNGYKLTQTNKLEERNKYMAYRKITSGRWKSYLILDFYTCEILKTTKLLESGEHLLYLLALGAR